MKTQPFGQFAKKNLGFFMPDPNLDWNASRVPHRSQKRVGKKMIGFERSLPGQIFMKYARNQIFIQFRRLRGTNGWRGRPYKVKFELLSGLVFWNWSNERKHIFLFPAVDIVHLQ